MYEKFTNLFGDIDKKIKDGRIVIEGDVNINIIESPNKEDENENNKEKKMGKAAVKTLRNKKSVKKWAQRIRTQDGVCQCCGEENQNKIQAHHIFTIAKYPELSADDGNGIALCDKCHSKYHQMYHENENAATFAKFMKDYGMRRY